MYTFKLGTFQRKYGVLPLHQLGSIADNYITYGHKNGERKWQTQNSNIKISKRYMHQLNIMAQ
jgi:hypothetical protein